MNALLEQLAQRLDLSAPYNCRLRLAFGHACVQRASHLLVRDDVVQGLREFGAYLDGQLTPGDFDALCERVEQAARAHPGSASIDGSQHAAVSATHALARALRSHALEAADYAAYAIVYAYGAYAVHEPSSFEQEHRAQCELLDRLACVSAPTAVQR